MKRALEDYLNRDRPEDVPVQASCMAMFKPWVPNWLRWVTAKLFTVSWSWTGW